MIQIITEKEYYTNIPQETEYRREFLILTTSPGLVEMHTDIIYLLVNNLYYVAYLHPLSFVLIPNQYDVAVVKEEINNTDRIMHMTDWTLTKVSDSISYALNVFIKGEIEISVWGIDLELTKGEIKGSWNLINERTKEIVPFELLSSYSTPRYLRIYIAFSEKAMIPMNREEVRKKSKFIELLIHGCKKSI